MIASLYDNFKHWSESGSVYLISDPHFDDEDSLLMNPNWLPANQHVEILNKKIHKNDTLICLGDCGDLRYFQQLKAGYKVLIKGNHDDKGNSVYQRKETVIQFNASEYTKKELREKISKEYPGYKFNIIDGECFNSPDEVFVALDNGLFDEVYDGPLFISEKILLSHEPINGLPFCCNIHGHCHNYFHDYEDAFGCKHINIASDVVDWKIMDLGSMIKSGIVSDITTIHRITIDKAAKNPIHKK